MRDPLYAGQLHGGSNGSTEAARADEPVTHGRAHIAYQRRVATENLYREHLHSVMHRRKDRT